MDLSQELSAQPGPERIAAVALALRSDGSEVGVPECPIYMAVLQQALRDEPPPFAEDSYREIFREAAADGQWLAISLITNAEREGDGATRLWSLAACSNDEHEQQLLKRHAVDESSHSLAYLALLDLSFPGAVTAEFRQQLNQLSPGYSMGKPLAPHEGSAYARQPSIDDYIQMNIAEIRTALHHLMQRTAIIEHCPKENLARAVKLLNSLLRDELSHVSYTAELIETKAQGTDPVAVQALFSKRLRDFNVITNDELSQRKFE